MNAPDFKPEPLDYNNPDFKGSLLPMMKQQDRMIDWKKHKTDKILRRINAADGSPGVLDEIYGKHFYIFNAYKATGLTGKPGDIIAVMNQGAYTFSTTWRWQRPISKYIAFNKDTPKDKFKPVKSEETFEQRYAGCRF